MAQVVAALGVQYLVQVVPGALYNLRFQLRQVRYFHSAWVEAVVVVWALAQVVLEKVVAVAAILVFSAPRHHSSSRQAALVVVVLAKMLATSAVMAALAALKLE